MKLPKITVCVCTYRRPALLERLLERLLRQQSGGAFEYNVVVADNDKEGSGQAVVGRLAAGSGVQVTYCVESEQNIALARNRALSMADGDYIAFIDDDEIPGDDWLRLLLAAVLRYEVDGVLGPVKPYFETPPPEWLVRGNFYNRPENPTGKLLAWQECRTGNTLFREKIIVEGEIPFRPEFGSGGEDRDFFRRKIAAGFEFVWCNEAVVQELVPPERWSRSFLLRRALLRGKASLATREGLAKRLAVSLVAIPAYAILVPFMAAGGQHLLMRYLVRLADHLGRVLGFFGVNPVSEAYVTR